MKKILFASLLLLSLNAIGQNAKQLPNGNYVSNAKEKAQAKKTGKTFTDKDGVVYPVFINGTGKLFVEKKSKKTGKVYRSYLKLDNK